LAVKQRFALVVIVAGFLMVGAAPATAGSGSVDRISDVQTVLAVRFDEDFPLSSLMRATCEWGQFVQRANGSGIEKLHCVLSSEPVMIPAFQGSPPSAAFVHAGGPCEWTSDYWLARDGSIVMAESFSYVVTPAGQVNITAAYPAEPLACEE
jgi:hypothetical protein